MSASSATAGIAKACHPTFSYVAIQDGDDFMIVKGAVVFNTTDQLPALGKFEHGRVKANRFLLKEIGLNPRKLLQQLISGRVQTPDGALTFPPENAQHFANYDPLHQVGLNGQFRLGVLHIGGKQIGHMNLQSELDWDLRASRVPYESFQELLGTYFVGTVGTGIGVEFVLMPVAEVVYASPVLETKATPTVHLVKGVSKSKFHLGYRVIVDNITVKRGVLPHDAFKWRLEGTKFIGIAELQIPRAATIQCFATYDGVAQHFGWLRDESHVSNIYRLAYESYDPDLKKMNHLIVHQMEKGDNARELEAAFSWLAWMLGFGVIKAGTQKENSADLLLSTPAGHIAVVEVTSGHLKADKVSKLHERTSVLRRKIQQQNSKNIRIIPVMVTSMSREDIIGDLPNAERLEILILTKDELDQYIKETRTPANADALFQLALQTIAQAFQKYQTPNTAQIEGTGV